jgi:hypothetical protein
VSPGYAAVLLLGSRGAFEGNQLFLDKEFTE